MLVEFDPEIGHLRLDQVWLGQLVRWCTSAASLDGGAVPVELREAGATNDRGELHGIVRLLRSAIADPGCCLAVRVRDQQGRAVVRVCWVHRDAAAVLLPLPGERYEVGRLHPSFLPEMLVTMVGLGPRPRLPRDSPVPASPELVDRLTDPDPVRRAAAADVLPVPGPAANVRRDWLVMSSWRSGDGQPMTRVVRVLDTPDGLWRVAADPEHQDRVLLHPTTPTAAWRALLGLLPIETRPDR